MLQTIIMNYDPEQERMFAAEEAAQLAEQAQQESERKTRIENAGTWEDILALAATEVQKDKTKAANILRDAAQQQPELLQRYKRAYMLEHNETYDIDLEIARINLYGNIGVSKVNYDLLEE